MGTRRHELCGVGVDRVEQFGGSTQAEEAARLVTSGTDCVSCSWLFCLLYSSACTCVHINQPAVIGVDSQAWY